MVDIMDKNAVAEEEQRVYESQVKEETKALRIAVIHQHLKYITDKKEISGLQNMITMALYLTQNDEETKEKDAERLSRQMELAMKGDEEAKQQVYEEAEVKEGTDHTRR